MEFVFSKSAQMSTCLNNLIKIAVQLRSTTMLLTYHCGYVTNNVTSTPTGEYFNLPGHSLVDLSITVSEQRSWKKAEYRK